MNVEEYAADFREEPGYLDFASVGPIGHAVAEEQAALTHVLEHARWGSMGALAAQDERMRRAISELTGFRDDEVVAQPDTSTALMHAAFGVTGGIACSRAESPSIGYAVQRAAETLGSVTPHWLEPEHGRVTPGELRETLDPSVVAVAVSLVDVRTGYLADLDGIRQVIGDRLLIVDATQGLGVVDAPWDVVDVLAAGGQTWPRAGWGTGLLAIRDRAAERLVPALSGHTGSGPELPMDEVRDPVPGAAAFTVALGDPLGLARLATATERILTVGVPAIAAAIAPRVDRIIDLADEHGIVVASPRAPRERAGIVVLDPGEGRLTPLVAALHNHGVSATARAGTVRLSAHVSTGEDSLGMLRDALTSFGTTTVL